MYGTVACNYDTECANFTFWIIAHQTHLNAKKRFVHADILQQFACLIASWDSLIIYFAWYKGHEIWIWWKFEHFMNHGRSCTRLMHKRNLCEISQRIPDLIDTLWIDLKMNIYIKQWLFIIFFEISTRKSHFFTLKVPIIKKSECSFLHWQLPQLSWHKLYLKILWYLSQSNSITKTKQFCFSNLNFQWPIRY